MKTNKIAILAIVIVIGIASLFAIGIRNAFYCPDIGKYFSTYQIGIEIKSAEEARNTIYNYYIPPNEHEAYNKIDIVLREVSVLLKKFETEEIIPSQKTVWDLDGIAIDEDGIIYVKRTGCL